MTIDLYTHLSDLNESELNIRFEDACRHGNFETVTLISKTNLLNFIDFEYKDDNGLMLACEYGHLNIVKFLLTTEDLKHKVDIHSNEEHALIRAAKYNHLEIVKFLLTSPELSEHCDIHKNNDLALRYACRKGYIDIVKYLIADPQLKDHADIHAKNDDPFISACGRERLDIIKYFIFELNIPKTKYIKEYLKDGFSDFSTQINKLFEQRELISELNTELPPNNLTNKKNKI